MYSSLLGKVAYGLTSIPPTVMEDSSCGPGVSHTNSHGRTSVCEVIPETAMVQALSWAQESGVSSGDDLQLGSSVLRGTDW